MTRGSGRRWCRPAAACGADAYTTRTELSGSWRQPTPQPRPVKVVGMKFLRPLPFLIAVLLLVPNLSVFAQCASPQLAIIDTDVGDDIDDAFALALALESPE